MDRRMWRTADANPRCVYAMAGSEPSSTLDEFLGLMDSPELAEDAVQGHNALLAAPAFVEGEPEEGAPPVPFPRGSRVVVKGRLHGVVAEANDQWRLVWFDGSGGTWVEVDDLWAEDAPVEEPKPEPERHVVFGFDHPDEYYVELDGGSRRDLVEWLYAHPDLKARAASDFAARVFTAPSRERVRVSQPELQLVREWSDPTGAAEPGIVARAMRRAGRGVADVLASATDHRQASEPVADEPVPFLPGSRVVVNGSAGPGTVAAVVELGGRDAREVRFDDGGATVVVLSQLAPEPEPVPFPVGSRVVLMDRLRGSVVAVSATDDQFRLVGCDGGGEGWAFVEDLAEEPASEAVDPLRSALAAFRQVLKDHEVAPCDSHIWPEPGCWTCERRSSFHSLRMEAARLSVRLDPELDD